MKRLAINPAGLRLCCIDAALRYYCDQAREGTLLHCVVCHRHLIITEGAWRAHPAGVT